MPFVRNELCAGCGICIHECLVQAIRIEKGIAIIDQDKCVKCGKCWKYVRGRQ